MSAPTLKPCACPGCPRLVRGARFCETHQREARQRADARRSQTHPWRHWYWTARWRARARAQLQAHPCCAECERHGMVTPARVCDHVMPHRGDPGLFWAGAVQSLCASCHSAVKQREERRGALDSGAGGSRAAEARL